MTKTKVDPTNMQKTDSTIQDLLTLIKKDKKFSKELAQQVIEAIKNDPLLAVDFTNLIDQVVPQSVASNEMILKAMKDGHIIIDPFSEDRLQTSSYDVSLGEYYWTTRAVHPGNRLFNPHNKKHIEKLWQGPFRAKTIREHLKSPEYKNYLTEEDFDGLELDDSVIILAPGETILAHTQEFIGGRGIYTTMMKARSSWGRAFLSVCKDAGWGDVGYFNRWTMEIQNNLTNEWSVVPVGQPIAQLIFFRVNPIKNDQYSALGNYQASEKIEDLKKKWTPEMMLPNLKRKRPQN